MTNTHSNNVVVSITVLSIAKQGHSCDAEITFNINGKEETSILKNAFITGLAKYRFNDPNNNKFEIGKKYTAENTSKVYDECPIKIKRTIGGKTGQLMYALSILNEGKPKRYETATPKGNVIQGYSFTKIMPSKWRRYSDYYNENRAAFLEKQKAEANA